MQLTLTESQQRIAATTAIVFIVATLILGIVQAAGEPDTAPVAAQQATATPSESPTPEATPTPTAVVAATPTPPPVATTKPAPAIVRIYKDGTYTTIGFYSVPGSGSEKITVTITIRSDVATATSAVAGANNRESAEYQAAFIGSYKPYVVGKSIANLSLGRISGSSLTPKGFNAALATIKTQAKK